VYKAKFEKMDPVMVSLKLAKDPDGYKVYGLFFKQPQQESATQNAEKWREITKPIIENFFTR